MSVTNYNKSTIVDVFLPSLSPVHVGLWRPRAAHTRPARCRCEQIVSPTAYQLLPSQGPGKENMELCYKIKTID